MISAFGVDHGTVISKKKKDYNKPSAAEWAGMGVAVPASLVTQVAADGTERRRSQRNWVRSVHRRADANFVEHRLAEEAAEPYRTRYTMGNHKALPAGKSTTPGPHAHWTAGRSNLTEVWRQRAAESGKVLTRANKELKQVRRVRNAAGAATLGGAALTIGAGVRREKKKQAQK